MSRSKNLRRLNTLVTSQTLFNLQRLSALSGSCGLGRTIDKLVRAYMLALRETEVSADGKCDTASASE